MHRWDKTLTKRPVQEQCATSRGRMAYNSSVNHRYRAIFVLGPSSSGKTTLCQALAEELGIVPPQYIKEIARTVMRTYGFTRKDIDTYEMQRAIMRAQLEAEKAATPMGEASPPLILSDRSAVDPIVYAGTSALPGATLRRQNLIEDVNLQEKLPFYRESLFVVLEPVREWIEDDGIRSLEDPWRYNEALVATLRELDIPYVTIGENIKDIRERVDLVLDMSGVRPTTTLGERRSNE
ncbi:AAA domain-containing protein [Trametes punicea]|nr:AAA domain-containing protein [Trametes punicea]